MQNNKAKLPELLAPAGSLEKLKIAVHYGADAVYIGDPRFSLRAHAAVSCDDLEKAILYAHDHSVKIYVTVNIFAHDNDFNGLKDYLLGLRDMKADGVILSDPGILALARRIIPEIPIHLSTQANVTNTSSALFWQNQGAHRLNLARELSLSELTSIRNATRTEIEVFVHGALCISYSGRCLLSCYLTGRDANRGDCAHPCRYKYALLEEKRPGQLFPVEEDSRGTYIFNSRDLCLLARLPELVRAGVDSLKIEGRMKSPYYVASVVRIYRAALDFLAESGLPAGSMEEKPFQMPDIFMEELSTVGSRGYTENFFDNQPDASDMLYHGTKSAQTHVPAGIVRQTSPEPLIEVRSPFKRGETIEYMKRGLEVAPYEIQKIHDQEGDSLNKANPGNLVTLTTSPPAEDWEPLALLRKR